MRFLLTVAVLLCLIGGRVFAEGAAEPARTVQAFYDKYLKVQDTKSWVLRSDQVTPGFKKVYAAFMKEPDYDPIVSGNDFPDSGYQVAGSVVAGETATVTLKSHDRGFPQPIRVHLVRRDGRWLINGVNGLSGK